jgi:hypothetical protein
MLPSGFPSTPVAGSVKVDAVPVVWDLVASGCKVAPFRPEAQLLCTMQLHGAAALLTVSDAFMQSSPASRSKTVMISALVMLTYI